MEVIHEGWLLKSPPPKRLRRAKWRNRWFLLRSGDLPGQYFLEYYTDSSRKKLKGTIDLDQCEQVDAGITFAERKFEYKYMFDIKTPKRIYYLCAETEDAMNKWVESVCQVCGLRVMTNEDLYDPMAQLSPTTPSTPHPNTHPIGFDLRRPVEMPHIDSPPPSASSNVSGPYIPISECITGKKPHSSSTRFPFEGDIQSNGHNQDRSQIPNEQAPPAPTSSVSYQHKSVSAQSQGTKVSTADTANGQSSSVDASLLKTEAEKCSTPSLRDESVFLESSQTKDGLGGHVAERTMLASESDSQVSVFVAPPRPPKPAYLTETNYMNIDTIIKANKRRNSLSDKSRLTSTSTNATNQNESMLSSLAESSQSLCPSIGFVPPNTPQHIGEESQKFESANNAMSQEVVANSDNAARCIASGEFSYDISTSNPDKNIMDPRISPASIYSNVPTPNSALYRPPVVDRGLKPKKTLDTSHLGSLDITSPLSAGASTKDTSSLGAVGGMPVPPSSAPPTVDRNLKPPKKVTEPSTTPFVLAPAPRSRVRNADFRTTASPLPTPLRNGVDHDSDSEDDTSTPGSRRDSICDEQVFFSMNSCHRRFSNEIQYLDLDLDAAAASQQMQKQASASKLTPLEASVVYKKVDFLKTEAFNKTRQSIEEGYRKGQ